HDPESSVLLGLGFYVPHMFRMLVFFVIAGLFARPMLERRGPRAFIGDRLRRIGLVLVAFWPVTLAGIIGVSIAAQRAGISVPPPPEEGGFPLLHLWFLYVLMLLYAATLALCAVAAPFRHRVASIPGSSALAALFASPAAPLLMAIPLAGALYVDPHWIAWFGIPTPDRLGLPGPAATIGYGSAFALGWWLAGRLGVLDVWAGHWPFHLVVAVITTVVCLLLSGYTPGFVALGGGSRTVVATAYALGAWSWAIGLTGLACRLFAGESPVTRYLADASYWIYLMHLPVVMALQAAVIPLPLPLPVKFAIVIGAALALLLLSYRLLVRRSWLGAWLNGRRRD
ncbi:MAG: acyltransferase family protein, partial [Novosphingobium sp.]|uniref:acyltransferase family protein n=1 Tax=Novosphingobium sp. TaxID=1874826 RepID=UPI0032B7D013